MKHSRKSKTLLLASLLVVGLSGTAIHSADRKSDENEPVALKGEQAIGSLKQDGVYDSLQAAVSAARYRIYADEKTSNAFYGNNPAQQLRAYFTPEAATLTVNNIADQSDELFRINRQSKTEAAEQGESSRGNPARETKTSHIALRFLGAGYGDAIRLAQGRPAITTADDRLTYTHQLTSNHNSTTSWLSLFARSTTGSPQSAIEEWYANKTDGIEHGFTLNQPIGERVDGQWLRLELGLDGDLLAQVVEEAKAIVFKSRDSNVQLSYANLKAYDALGKELAARMSVNDGVLYFEVDDANAVYPVTIDPTFSQQTKLTTTSVAGRFGQSVAVDGNTAVIGAPDEYIGGNQGQGAAYVFVRSGTTWSQQARLAAFDGVALDGFGTSVALDGETAAVGSVIGGVGAVYVFVRNFPGTTWSLQQKLVASDATSGDQFGRRVSISANTIIVGAPYDDNGSITDQGSAYVFVRNGTTWIQQQKLTGLNSADDLFGSDVTIDGDYAACSALGATAFGVEGLVFIFHRTGTTWSQQNVSGGDTSQRTTDDDFGISIALSGDTLVIGAPSRTITSDPPSPCAAPAGCGDQVNCESLCGFFGAGGDCYCCSKTTTNGTVHVLVRSGTVWSVQQTIVGTGTLNTCRRILDSDHLGESVAISGNTIVIGSPQATFHPTTKAGRLSIWVRSGTTWTSQHTILGNTDDQSIGQTVAIDGDTVIYYPSGVNVLVRSGATWSTQATLAPQASANSDEFGSSVALSSGINGSGEVFYRAVVGVPKADVGTNSDEGEVCVFESVNHGPWSLEARLSPNDGAASDQFGYSVAISGDTIVAGSLLDDVGANSNQGSAYVFTLSGINWTQQQKLTASDGAPTDFFGRSVGISGDTVVVGADLDNVGTNADQGSAYVFTRSGTTWTQQQKLTALDGAASDGFGFSVGISGDTVIAAAHNDQVGSNVSQGSAYVFTRSGTAWTQQQKLTASDGAADDNFGNAVAISDNTVIVGAYSDDVGAPNNDKGSAYIFARSGTVWSQQQKLTASDGAANDNFGSAVAIDTDTAIVGATGSDIGGNTDQGAAYVFTRSLAPALWSERQKFTAGDGAAFDGFGNAVAVIAQVFVIGANLDDLGSVPNAGSAYIFTAFPANISWTGATSSNWHTDTNWASNFAPISLDDATLPASDVTNEAVISAADVSLNSLTIETGRQLTINAGRTLTVNGNLTLNGTITGSGTLIFNGADFINNNSINNVNVQFGGAGAQQLSGTGLFLGNTVTVLSGSTLQLVTNHTMDRIVVNSGGTLNISIHILSLLSSGLALTNNGSVTGTGAVSFDGNSAQSTSGNVAFSGLTINNSAGVTLGADSTVDGVLNLARGDLNTGSFTLTMPATAMSTGTTDVVGNVKRTGFTTANTLSFGNPFNTIRFTSGTPSIDVTVNLVKQTPIDFINSVRRTYTITPNGGSGFAATIRLHYLDSELNSNTEATLGLWRRGASWLNLGATTRNATDNWVELAGIAQFSPWVISGPAAPVCGYAVSPASRFFPVSGGAGGVNVTTSSSCSWTALASDSWITITSADSGAGNDVVTYEVRENFTGSARQAFISISGANHIVVQDGGLGEDCGYSINPTFQSFPANGGGGTIDVIVAERCGWQAIPSTTWITITSSSVGIGNGTVSYTVAANPGAGGRKGTITIGGQVFAVKQKGS